MDETPPHWRWQDQNLIVTTLLASGQTAAIAVGDPAAQRTLNLMIARDRIGDIKLCATEHELRNSAPHPLKQAVDALVDEAAPAAVRRLKSLASDAGADDPMTVRMRELATDAAAHLAEAISPQPTSPAGLPRAHDLPRRSLTGSLTEEFDSQPDPGLWRIDAEKGQIGFMDGHLRLELTDPGGIHVALRNLIDFGTRPTVLEVRFRNQRGDGSEYMGTFFGLYPVVDMQDRVLVRIDNAHKIWIENGDTLASRWTRPLFDWKPLEPDGYHVLKLYLDGEQYRLEIDDELYGEGLHNLHFATAEFRLQMQSGHGGNGAVWFVDWVRIGPAPSK